jgi:CyaY protein
MAMDEQDFKNRADEALSHLHRALIGAADDYGFDVDFNAGALSVEFEDPPAKFVVSPNAPVRQIWVSAHAKSYKLDWDIVENAFVHGESKDTLKELVEKAISKQLKEEVSL